MKTNTVFLRIAGLGLALGLAGAAQAIEVGGLKFDDTVKVAGKELKVNGAGITANTDKAERSKFVNQLAQFGDAFVSIPAGKKGDVITVDWVPDTGTVMTYNGKPIGEPMKDVAFYNAVLKIWLGDKPVDSSLKPQLLGAKG